MRIARTQAIPLSFRLPAGSTVRLGVGNTTKRDAIIGAAAGAAIGVASTRNTLKGAIIGAAAGGLIGAVVGEKIDVRRPR